MLSISQDGTIIAWDTQSGTIAHEWFAHAEGLGQGEDAYGLALSPDSRRLVSVGVSGSGILLEVWDLTNGVRRDAAPEGHRDSNMIACAWSPDGALIASASLHGTVRVWDALTFRQFDVHETGQRFPRARHLQFSPDARYLTWTDGSNINFWSRPEEDQPRRPLLQLKYDAMVNALSFNPESTRIVTAHGWKKPEDYVIRIWDIATGVVLALLTGHTAEVRHASFSPDGRSILSIQAGPDGRARIWDAVSWKETLSFEIDGGSGCFSPCGKYIATWGKQVKLWRASDGFRLVTFTEHESFVTHAAFSPNCEFLASGDEDGIVHIRHISNFI
ncbi:hypothetical protein GSI_14352 [Ganoderma sinense ZZ0214-1]|uniref:Uncharacterized protein n=1 Tax=Ganoderma sinense ZZ0214-1 TaxID=1077348 RepID=A0A2G8RNF0_9APHY|nr:hypothetical protein GSI_14352 [Ganoderma sinense ZZ0214-1]